MRILSALLSFLLVSSVIAAQNRYDVVIDEIMADPSPQVGLPTNEWVELRNTSSLPVNLQNWRLGDLSGQSGPMPNFILKPDSVVIVCATSALTAMNAFGKTIAVTSFPSLDNNGDQLFLKAAGGKIIHAASYSVSWYQNELKKDGGWTLEMIDTKNPCSGMGNWKASTDASGGTPGRKNSIDGMNNDTQAPQLKRAYTTGNSTIILVFDEPLDSLSGAALSNYSIDGNLSLSAATTLPPLFNTVQLKTNAPLTANTIYTVTVSSVTDCKGNVTGNSNKAKTGLPAGPGAADFIINEILFNPRPDGYDYVEFYNKSDKILDLSKIFIANRNSSGSVNSAKQLSAVPFYIFPGDYMVATEDAASLALNYLVKAPDAVFVISSMPSFPDDEGTVVALDFQGNILDEVSYKDDWHFKLIDNAEGVALERVDPAAVSQDPANWHSAASTAGYGTPGYQNSQYKQVSAINAAIAITPKVFSPDNDGFDDIASIQYTIDAPGYVANITVFDAAGRPVRSLVRNGTLALSGYWNWDGLGDKGQKLPVGNYIILTELFNLEGKKRQFKNVVVLARKLN